MRVLVVTNMYPSEQAPGVGAVVADQVEDLRALGASVELVVIRGRLGKRQYLEGAREVRRRVRRERFDVIHAHYGLTGVVASMQRRVPVSRHHLPRQRHGVCAVAGVGVARRRPDRRRSS